MACGENLPHRGLFSSIMLFECSSVIQIKINVYKYNTMRGLLTFQKALIIRIEFIIATAANRE